jgi:hypothetical protein
MAVSSLAHQLSNDTLVSAVSSPAERLVMSSFTQGQSNDSPILTVVYHTLLDGSNVRLNWNIESDMNVN